MTAAIHQPQYWPGLRFFSKMRASGLFIYLDDVQFEKREFQNRNRIRTPRGWQYLTVPVLTKGRFSQKISEVEIDNGEDWRHDHLSAIRQNYSRARYFEEYLPGLRELYEKEYRLLQDLAYATIDFMRSGLGIKTPCARSSSYGVEAASSGRLSALCLAAGAGEYLSGAGARAYLDEGTFRRAGVSLAWQSFSPAPYPQAFKGFEADMSALDLLLNCGPESGKWL